MHTPNRKKRKMLKNRAFKTKVVASKNQDKCLAKKKKPTKKNPKTTTTKTTPHPPTQHPPQNPTLPEIKAGAIEAGQFPQKNKKTRT